ncbi:hypothetical protein NMY22_g11077 [Coprinellus aureogranulatus]|nr:hypothetical protein NMY22_g11077 [Coprinellus aureogranulatus]
MKKHLTFHSFIQHRLTCSPPRVPFAHRLEAPQIHYLFRETARPQSPHLVVVDGMAGEHHVASTQATPPVLPNTTVPEDDLADRVTEKRSAGLSVEEGPVSKKNGADEGGERYNWDH